MDFRYHRTHRNGEGWRLRLGGDHWRAEQDRRGAGDRICQIHEVRIFINIIKKLRGIPSSTQAENEDRQWKGGLIAKSNGIGSER